MIDFDGAWKFAIERTFQWMILLLNPALAAEIDWNVLPEFLDQELPSLNGMRKRGGRIVDKLVKVHLRNGSTRYLLIHMEIQNKRDPGFPERVFTIYYRLRDKYHLEAEITCLVILTDLNPNWRPDSYEHEAFGVHLRFDYPTIKLMDLEDQLLAAAEVNPFALIATIHLDLMRRRAELDPVAWKRGHLLRALRRSGQYSARDAATILAFIDWLMRLPSELDNQLKVSINENMKEAGMEWAGGIHGNIRILALAEGREEGRREGLKEGLKEGLDEGHQAGHKEGLENGRKMLLQLLNLKFGDVPESLVKQVETASWATIHDWVGKIMAAKDLTEVLSS